MLVPTPTNFLARLAGAVLLCPPETIERSIPMLAPIVFSGQEIARRRSIDKLLALCWRKDDGYEVQLQDEWLVNNGKLYEYNDEFSLKPSTYGEITPLGARQLFQSMGMTTSQDIVFMDFGSGAGRLVGQAFLELNGKIERSIGVELAPSRHAAAVRARTKLMDELKSSDDTLVHLSPPYELYEEDLFSADVSNATHVYVSSLCFTHQMMERLETKLRTQAVKLEVVASLQMFPSATVSGTSYVQMSWTEPYGCQVYFYTKPDFI